MSGHGMEMPTYFWKDQFSYFSENTASNCLFYHKNCSSRNSPFLPTCEQINIWLFHFGSCSCFRGRRFLWVWGRKGFFQPGSNYLSFLALFFLHCKSSLILQIPFSPLCANSADHFHLLNTPPGRPCLPSICADTAIFDCVYLKCDHAFSVGFAVWTP